LIGYSDDLIGAIMSLEKNNNRLIIVSNRLPITLQKSEESFSFKKSSGGLVTAINGKNENEKF